MARVLVEVARRSFRRSTQYRLGAASGVFVNTVFGYIRASVLVAVATAGDGAVRGLDTRQLATFAFVSQGFIMVTGAFGDREFAQRITTGEVVVDFHRPVDIQAWWLAVWLGKAAWQVVARGVPPVVLGALTFDLAWPEPSVLLPFSLSVALASVVGFSLRFLSSLTTFWLLDSRGIDQMVTVAISFFAGLLLPISLFPGWLEGAARALPFASMIQVPTEIWLGVHQGVDLVVALAMQLVWATALLLAGRVLLAAATRKVVIQGG